MQSMYSATEDEIIVLKQTISDLKKKLSTVATYANQLKHDKEAFMRIISEKDETIDKLNSKLKSFEKIDKDLNNKNNTNKVEDLFNLKEYNILNNVNLSSKIEEENITVNLYALEEKSSDNKLKYLLNRLNEDNNKKANQIKNLTEELTSVRFQIEEIKANETSNYQFILSKISKTTMDNQYLRLSKENSNLKTQILSLEIKNKELIQINKSFKDNSKTINSNDVKAFDKDFNQIDYNNNDLTSSEKQITTQEKSFKNIKEDSYKKIYNEKYYKLLNQYRQTACVLEHSFKNSRKYCNYYNNTKEELLKLNNNYLIVSNKNTELESELEKHQFQIRGNYSELDHLKDKVVKLQSLIDQLQTSKKTYNVVYYYLGLPYDGKFIFERNEDNEYIFCIEHKTKTYTINWLESIIYIKNDNTSSNVSLSKNTVSNFGNNVDNFSELSKAKSSDNNENKQYNIKKETSCIVIKNINENTECEYYSEESYKIVLDFEFFKKKSIESGRFKNTVTNNGVSTVMERTEKDAKNLKDKENILKDIFGL